MITPATFKIRFPEFASIDDTRIQLFIDDSVILLNESHWGEKYDLGLYYLTAHYLTLSINTDAGKPGFIGPVASKSVDGTSIAFAVNSSDDLSVTYLSSTTYGQRYLSLIRSLGVSAYVV